MRYSLNISAALLFTVTLLRRFTCVFTSSISLFTAKALFPLSVLAMISSVLGFFCAFMSFVSVWSKGFPHSASGKFIGSSLMISSADCARVSGLGELNGLNSSSAIASSCALKGSSSGKGAGLMSNKFFK